MLNTAKARRYIAAGSIAAGGMLAGFNASAQALPGIGSGVGPGIDLSVTQNAVKDQFNGAVDNSLANRFESAVKWALNIPLSIGKTLTYGLQGPDDNDDDKLSLMHLVLKFAYVESGYNNKAVNGRSSACGTLQFTRDKFVETLKKYGADGGYANLADKIQMKSKALPGGIIKVSYEIPDSGDKRKILAACHDEKLSLYLGRRATEKLKDRLTDKLGREPTDKEVYAGHVFGDSGGPKFVEAVLSQPDLSVSKVVKRDQLNSNPDLLKDDHGMPKTVGKVMQELDQKMDDAEAPARQKAIELGLALN